MGSGLVFALSGSRSLRILWDQNQPPSFLLPDRGRGMKLRIVIVVGFKPAFQPQNTLTAHSRSWICSFLKYGILCVSELQNFWEFSLLKWAGYLTLRLQLGWAWFTQWFKPVLFKTWLSTDSDSERYSASCLRLLGTCLHWNHKGYAAYDQALTDLSFHWDVVRGAL